MLNLISKPLLVDLLRTFDHKKWLQPKIRYASVRSKSQLITDIMKRFEINRKRNLLTFVPKFPHPIHPKITYDLKKKTYLFDGKALDIPNFSRAKGSCRFLPGPWRVFFDFRRDRLMTAEEQCTRTASDSNRIFPRRDTGVSADCPKQSAPSLPCSQIPT